MTSVFPFAATGSYQALAAEPGQESRIPQEPFTCYGKAYAEVIEWIPRLADVSEGLHACRCGAGD